MEKTMTRNAPRAARTLTGLALVLMASVALAQDVAAPAAAPAAAAPAADAAAAPAAPAVSPRIAKIAQERAHTMVNKWCSACHGYNGRSIAPTFPVLAAQTSDYIVQELKFFHNLTQDDRTVTHESFLEQTVLNITGLRKEERYEDAPRNEERAWDFMKGVARDLDEPTMQALADYFAKQTPIAGRVTPGGGDIARGKTLFMDGDAEKGLMIACQVCHGPEAKGQGGIPRLAGQHADYVVVQLQAIKSGLRNVEQMQALVANLSDADLAAVAAYVQSLN